MARLFLDTNIFVYTFDSSAQEKQRIARALIEDALRLRNAVVSYHVVQEFLNVALRRFRPRLPVSETRTYLDRVLMPMCEVYPDARLYTEALTIAEETGWSFYDCLIMSSAVAARCDSLISENLQDNRVVHGVKVRNPFRSRRMP